MTPDKSYHLSKEFFWYRFGNEYMISAAYIDKALAWPPVKADNVKALQAFSDFL